MRPFARPLMVWITGILLQVVFTSQSYFFVLLLPPLIVMTYSFVAFKKEGVFYAYDARWVWGAILMCLLLFLSVQKTYYSERAWEETSSKSWLQQLAATEQQRLLGSLDSLCLSDAEKSVLGTLTLGYAQAMDREIRSRFSVTGVAHILSVSGFHVAIICGFLSLLLSFLPRGKPFKWMKYVLTVGLLWVFVAVTGLAASSVRSALMLSLYLTGSILRRRTDGYNTLAAAAFCMLVYEPFYLFDIGFQLSYIAVFFIIYLQPRLQALIEVRNPVLAIPWGWITVTLAAQIGTTCLCLYYFGQFSTVFLLTNLPLTALATLLIPAGLIWILLPAGIPGYEWLQSVVEWLTRSLLWVVDSFSRVSFVAFTFRFSFFMLLAGYGILLFSLLYRRTRRTSHLFAALILLLIMLLLLLIEKLKLCEI